MSNATFDRLRLTANGLISKYGASMALVSRSNTGTDWNPVLTSTETAIIGVIAGYKPHELNGETIRYDDVKVITDASIEPLVTMRLLIGGIEYSIINVEQVKPDNEAIIYRIQARR